MSGTFPMFATQTFCIWLHDVISYSDSTHFHLPPPSRNMDNFLYTHIHPDSRKPLYTLDISHTLHNTDRTEGRRYMTFYNFSSAYPFIQILCCIIESTIFQYGNDFINLCHSIVLTTGIITFLTISTSTCIYSKSVFFIQIVRLIFQCHVVFT